MSRRTGVAVAVALALIMLAVLVSVLRRSDDGRVALVGSASTHERAHPATDPSRQVTVRVHVTSGGAPVAGAKVVIERDRDGQYPPLASAVSAADGTLTLSGIPRGSYQLFVVHPELAKHRRDLELVADRMELEVSLERGVRIEGTVVDRQRRAIADATVHVIGASSTTEHAKQQTDATGVFSVTGLELADYRLYVFTGRHRPRWEGPIHFERQGEVRRIAIQVEDGRTLSGRVVDARGRGISGAQIGASDEGSTVVTSDADGSFELGGLADAPVNIFATAPGYGPTHVRAAVPGGKPLDIVLERAASIEGELRLDASARSVLVSVCHYDDQFKKELCVARQRYEPPEARFRLQNLPIGAHDLVIEADRHRTARVPVSLSPGQNFTVPLVVLELAPDAN